MSEIHSAGVDISYRGSAAIRKVIFLQFQMLLDSRLERWSSECQLRSSKIIEPLLRSVLGREWWPLLVCFLPEIKISFSKSISRLEASWNIFNFHSSAFGFAFKEMFWRSDLCLLRANTNMTSIKACYSALISKKSKILAAQQTV